MDASTWGTRETRRKPRPAPLNWFKSSTNGNPPTQYQNGTRGTYMQDMLTQVFGVGPCDLVALPPTDATAAADLLKMQ